MRRSAAVDVNSVSHPVRCRVPTNQSHAEFNVQPVNNINAHNFFESLRRNPKLLFERRNYWIMTDNLKVSKPILPVIHHPILYMN